MDGPGHMEEGGKSKAEKASGSMGKPSCSLLAPLLRRTCGNAESGWVRMGR
jgi:hypothetical protein